MTDNEKKFISEDQININEKLELEYWCEKYNIKSEELIKMISEVGPFVKDVEKKCRRR